MNGQGPSRVLAGLSLNPNPQPLRYDIPEGMVVIPNL